MRTKRKNYFCVLIILLVLIEIATIFLMYKSSNNKNTLLDNVSLKEQVSNMNGLAIMLETTQTDGTTKYVESTSNAFPTDMKYNEELSGCIDNLGNKIPNSLTFVNGTAKVETDNTTVCYLYFDIPPINAETLPTTSGDIWQSTLEDDGYRYVGTNPNNYVCFGYNNATTDCDFTSTTNTDLYAYRIIGIFEDSEGTPHIKLIKKEALNTSYAWNADYQNDVDWDASDLYKGLNGDYFLDNPTYSYMQDTDWTDKIVEWEYTATNTKSYENYKTTGTTYGPNYYYQVVRTTYLHEMNRSSKANCYYNASTTADCNIEGSWKTVKGKISLMYVSDYQLSLGSTALDYTNNTSAHYQSMKTGWMHISNNDSGAPSQYEWTSSRYGFSGGWYGAWNVNSNGNVNLPSVNNTYSVRPVFYLTSEVELSGEGTSTSPYIIK